MGRRHSTVLWTVSFWLLATVSGLVPMVDYVLTGLLAAGLVVAALFGVLHWAGQAVATWMESIKEPRDDRPTGHLVDD